MKLRRGTDLSEDSGVFAILFALVIFTVVGIAGLTVDVGSLRLDREAGRAASDASATAGAAVLSTGGPRVACVAAMNYALSNLDLVATPTCPEFPTTMASCASTVASSATVNGITVRVRWPIQDADPAMTFPDVRPGSATQNITTSDGQPCSRIAVDISRPRTFKFAALLGARAGSTTTSSVAAATMRNSGNGSAPLVSLDPNSCNALNVNGGAHVLVTHADTPDVTGAFAPGRVIVDSDGAGGAVNCNGGVTTIDASNNSWIRAQDGLNADLSAGALATISSYAVAVGNSDAYESADVSGCVHSSTNVSGALCPVPSASSGRVGQFAFDSAFNCKLSNGCTSATSSSAYIDQLISFAAAPTYARYSSCTTPTIGTTVISGNVWVDCPSGFKVRNTTVFTGNKVVFNGDVSTQGAGACLLFGVNAILGTPVTCLTPAVSLLPYSASTETTVYIAGGLAIPSNTTLVAPQTFMMIRGLFNVGGTLYQTAPFGQTLTGSACTPGSAAAPPSTSCFANLAIWDDFVTSSQSHNLSGGGGFRLDGALYLPVGEFVFNGNSSANQTNAQFVANRITITGGGELTLTPSPSRQILFGVNAGGLIR